jgi:prevent-host-death family protein
VPIIKAISELTNRATKLSEILRRTGEPIFITKNGEGDMVLLSIAQYRQLKVQLDVYSKLALAQVFLSAGDPGRELEDVAKDLRKVARGVR